jgi:hypothetical protein
VKQDFPASMPRDEQIARRKQAQKPGRKHQKRPGVRAKERMRASLRRGLERRSQLAKDHKRQVAAYFRGERDTYPGKP